MRRTIIHNPEDSSCRAISILAHDIVHQAIKMYNTGFRFTSSEHLGELDVPGNDVSQRTASFVYKFDFHALLLPRSKSGVFSASNLNTGFFIRTENEFIRLQGDALLHPLIQIQNTSSFLFKLWISGKYPTAILPGFDDIFMKPTPDGRSTKVCNDASFDSLASNLISAKPRQRYLLFKRQLAG